MTTLSQCYLTSNGDAIWWREQATFQWDDDGVHFVLNKHS